MAGISWTSPERRLPRPPARSRSRCSGWALQPGAEFGLPPTAGESLVLVEQGELFLERGKSDVRELLGTVIGSDTAYAVRSVAAPATLHGSREATSVLIATIE